METISRNKSTTDFSNAVFVDRIEMLSSIHQEEKNIAICQRDILRLQNEIARFESSGLQFKTSGTKAEILKLLFSRESDDNQFPMLFQDIAFLLEMFEEVSGANSFRIVLFTVNTNMCRRFHTDINDIRLLCTYSGQGTFWLPEEAVDRATHHHGGDNDEIVKHPELIQQALEGDVLLLKGALYPKAKAIIHRSPSVEESGENRLLLRIDTNESLL